MREAEPVIRRCFHTDHGYKAGRDQRHREHEGKSSPDHPIALVRCSSRVDVGGERRHRRGDRPGSCSERPGSRPPCRPRGHEAPSATEQPDHDDGAFAVAVGGHSVGIAIALREPIRPSAIPTASAVAPAVWRAPRTPADENRPASAGKSDASDRLARSSAGHPRPDEPWTS